MRSFARTLPRDSSAKGLMTHSLSSSTLQRLTKLNLRSRKRRPAALTPITILRKEPQTPPRFGSMRRPMPAQANGRMFRCSASSGKRSKRPSVEACSQVQVHGWLGCLTSKCGILGFLPLGSQGDDQLMAKTPPFSGAPFLPIGRSQTLPPPQFHSEGYCMCSRAPCPRMPAFRSHS